MIDHAARLRRLRGLFGVQESGDDPDDGEGAVRASGCVVACGEAALAAARYYAARTGRRAECVTSPAALQSLESPTVLFGDFAFLSDVEALERVIAIGERDGVRGA